jgi:hypothetical protein
VNVWFDLLCGFVLFVIFERKRFPGWRDKFLAMRARAFQAGTNRALAARLATAGFFADLSPQESQEVRSAVETRGYSGVFDQPWRVMHADDEELSEGQVGEFLRLCAPSLERLGIAPLVGESRFIDGGAQLLDLPRETVTLVSEKEAHEEGLGGGLERFSWGAVGARLLQRMNDDLAAAGRPDRFYSVYSGNDAHALLLTQPMLAAIVATPGIRRSDLPYTRIVQWPNFGMDISSTLT